MTCWPKEGENLRPLPFEARRARLERLVQGLDPARVDLSPLVPVADWETAARLRAAPPHPAIEGLMLKRRDAPTSPAGRRGRGSSGRRTPTPSTPC